jgi:hypothetical protein
MGSFLPHPSRRMPSVPQAQREEEIGQCAVTN